MAIMMTMLIACAQENTADNNSNNNSNNSSASIGEKWKRTDGLIVGFKNGNIYYEDGSLCGTYQGNDTQGELEVDDGRHWFNYTISGNSMTWTDVNSYQTYYFTRM